MSKTEVYSWRVDPALKRDLEAAARAEKTSVSAVLDRACRSWLEHSGKAKAGESDKARRRRVLHEIVNSARALDPGGATTPSATNVAVRTAFAQKQKTERKRRPRPAG